MKALVHNGGENKKYQGTIDDPRPKARYHTARSDYTFENGLLDEGIILNLFRVVFFYSIPLHILTNRTP